MPFRSQAQRRYLFATNPKVAREFADATPKGARLPEHVGGKKMAGKSPFPIMNEKQDKAEDMADARRKRMNKGKLPGLEKMPMAAMKKGKR